MLHCGTNLLSFSLAVFWTNPFILRFRSFILFSLSFCIHSLSQLVQPCLVTSALLVIFYSNCASYKFYCYKYIHVLRPCISQFFSLYIYNQLMINTIILVTKWSYANENEGKNPKFPITSSRNLSVFSERMHVIIIMIHSFIPNTFYIYIYTLL